MGHEREHLGGRSESGWLSLLCLALSCFFPALLGVDQPCLIPAAGVSKSQVSIYDMHCYWGEGRSCHCNITGECWGEGQKSSLEKDLDKEAGKMGMASRGESLSWHLLKLSGVFLGCSSACLNAYLESETTCRGCNWLNLLAFLPGVLLALLVGLSFS